jgi:hypothetical protein
VPNGKLGTIRSAILQYTANTHFSPDIEELLVEIDLFRRPGRWPLGEIGLFHRENTIGQMARISTALDKLSRIFLLCLRPVEVTRSSLIQ